MRSLLALAIPGLLVAVAAAPAAEAPAKPVRPVPAIDHVLIISVDGLRPDRVLLANTPVMHGLMRDGTYTFWAQTTAVAITLPSHTSMLTGVVPRKHKIEWNMDLPLREMVYPAFPTIFEIARKAGYTTALVTGKSKFEPLAKPGTLDHLFMPQQDFSVDEPVGDEAVRVVAQLKPELLFVHFPAVDKAGHKFGWGSKEQLAAIERADVQIGRVLEAVDRAGLKNSTFVIVTADHGGAGKTHGAEDPRSRFIPWLVTGPGVKHDFDLTQIWELTVHTEDTAAMALYLLGLPRSDDLDGKPVLPVFENPPKS